MSLGRVAAGNQESCQSTLDRQLSIPLVLQQEQDLVGWALDRWATAGRPRRRNRDIRVAVFTASNIPHDNAAARAAGCCAVFKKPLGLNELTAIMKSLPAMWEGAAEG